MPGIYPNPGAAAENFTPGDVVKQYKSEKAISPYTGRVTEVHPGINKVDVQWQVGGNERMDPTDLIMVTPYTGTSPVTQEFGYDSYDKSKSKKEYGTLRERMKEKAKKVAANYAGVPLEEYTIRKMAVQVSERFASEVVDNLAEDIVDCAVNGMSDVQTYQKLYPKYANICSDGFMRTAIMKIYTHSFEKK